MFKEERVRHVRRSAIVGLAALLLLVLPVVTAYAGQRGATFSGDDAYDPAAGGRPELSVFLAYAWLKSSGTSSYSGDDLYDPAAVSVFWPASRAATRTYSGDDAYDPAAGGDPVPACDLAAAEIIRRIVLHVPGGLSGDAAYDPAAGGWPELSLLALAQEPGRGLACLPEPGDN
jgi:hypothetical protein